MGPCVRDVRLIGLLVPNYLIRILWFLGDENHLVATQMSFTRNIQNMKFRLIISIEPKLYEIRSIHYSVGLGRNNSLVMSEIGSTQTRERSHI